MLRTLPGCAQPQAAVADAPPRAVDRLDRDDRGRYRRILILAAGGTHRGTGRIAGGHSAPAGLQQVQLSQFAANDYNPFGTGPENRDLVENVIDNDPNTTWSTEQYYCGTLKKAGGTGLGIYLDAAPGVVAKALKS